ncbi:MAG TPA: hypothetical protein VGF84_19640 [Micromonosporaceae bacterium]
MSRLRWWIAGSVVIVVILAVAGAVIYRDVRPHHAPTVSTVTPSLDRAIAGVVAAAGDTAAATVTELVPTTSCDGGSIYTVTANLYTNAGGEGAVIDRIAAAVPASQQPRRSAALNGGASALHADLGAGATLQVIQLDAGWISATATSGCRSAPSAPPSVPAPAAAATALTRSLSALGTAPTTFHTDEVACANGAIVTVSTASGPLDLTGIHAKLATLPPAGVTVFASTADRIAWRSGDVSTVIGAADAGTHVDAQQTTGCV